MTFPECVCGHAADEHHDMWGCVGVVVRHAHLGPRPCLCAEYEADEVMF